MRTLNLDLDLHTGAVFALGKDGRRYTLEAVDAAERAARRGDAAAAATLRALDHGVAADGAPLSPAQALAQLVHDCPDCQAARARGEQPIAWSADAGWQGLPAEAADAVEPGLEDVRRPTNSHARRRARERRRRGLAT